MSAPEAFTGLWAISSRRFGELIFPLRVSLDMTYKVPTSATGLCLIVLFFLVGSSVVVVSPPVLMSAGVVSMCQGVIGDVFSMDGAAKVFIPTI